MLCMVIEVISINDRFITDELSQLLRIKRSKILSLMKISSPPVKKPAETVGQGTRFIFSAISIAGEISEKNEAAIMAARHEEELASLREALGEAEVSMKEAEARREELLPLLAAEGECDPEALLRLDDALADCEEIKETMEGLWERVDMLAEELSETLWWLRGTCA